MGRFFDEKKQLTTIYPGPSRLLKGTLVGADPTSPLDPATRAFVGARSGYDSSRLSEQSGEPADVLNKKAALIEGRRH